jgi:hypothetical protein
MFMLGQLVICVAPPQEIYAAGLLARTKQLAGLVPSADQLPLRGCVYTISAIFDDCPSCHGTHVMLEELAGADHPGEWFKPCRPANFERFMARLFPQLDDGRMTG